MITGARLRPWQLSVPASHVSQIGARDAISIGLKRKLFIPIFHA